MSTFMTSTGKTMREAILEYAKSEYEYLAEDASDFGTTLKNHYMYWPQSWETIRACVTTYFILEDIAVDTQQGDSFMTELCEAFRPDTSFEEFENYMYKLLV